MKPEAPKFIVVYQDNPNGYCYTLRNSKNEYASVMTDMGPYKRSWRTAAEAELYLTKWADSSLIWSAYNEWTPPIRRVVTVAAYKPSHGGYSTPIRYPAYTGRMVGGSNWPDAIRRTAKSPAFSAPCSDQPIVWPIIPQVDDGSNEEASTVPDVIVVAAIVANSRTLLGGLLAAMSYYPNL